MTLSDFVCNFMQVLDPDNPNEETLRRLGTMADTTQDELVIKTIKVDKQRGADHKSSSFY